MKLSLSFLIFLTSQIFLVETSFALGPFGRVTNDSIGDGNDQSKCTAEEIIKEVTISTGLDLVGGSVKNVWTCDKNEGHSTASSRGCPNKQYMTQQKYTCYSDSSRGKKNSIYACVSGASSVNVRESYSGQAKPSDQPRARFKSLHVFSTSVDGSRQNRSYEMDIDGCNAESGRIPGNNIDFKSCGKDFGNLLDGKTIPFANPPQKFCATNTSNNLGAIK